jgi:RNA polymerase sigma-70 factor (ECF subfamily)
MRDRHDDVVGRLAEACRAGDVDAIRAVLAPDAVVVCDGIGRGPVHGADRAARLIALLLGGDPGLGLASVNGSAGLVRRRAGRAVAVAAVEIAVDRVAAVWIVVNPAKLGHWTW